MEGASALLLRCPLCRQRLHADARLATCGAGHSFDRAREGYLNLLPVQRKNSLEPGDAAAMVGARADFLEAGYYTPLRDALVGQLAGLAPEQLLDCGCGEGWYTVAMSRSAHATTALDISRSAIKRAARRDRAITWLVASSVDLPLFDASVDVVTAIFSPLAVAEAARVLKPGGSLVIVAPDQHHLQELRAALYPKVRPHEPDKWLAALAPAFVLHNDARVQFRIDLPDNSALRSLLLMTPYYWRAPRGRREAVEALPGISTRVDCRLMRFVRTR